MNAKDMAVDQLWMEDVVVALGGNRYCISMGSAFQSSCSLRFDNAALVFYIFFYYDCHRRYREMSYMIAI